MSQICAINGVGLISAKPLRACACFVIVSYMNIQKHCPTVAGDAASCHSNESQWFWSHRPAVHVPLVCQVSD
jgi:hypothetical protein